MRTNPRGHVKNGLLIGCLLHALYKTSTPSTPRRFFFLSLSLLAFHILKESGPGVTQAMPCLRLPGLPSGLVQRFAGPSAPL